MKTLTLALALLALAPVAPRHRRNQLRMAPGMPGFATPGSAATANGTSRLQLEQDDNHRFGISIRLSSYRG